MEDNVSSMVDDKKKIILNLSSIKGIVRLASHNDMPQLKQLRLTEFLSSKVFSVVNSELVATDDYDASDINLVVCDANENIIATTRGGIIRDKAHAHERFHFVLPLDEKDFPALFLSKAATVSKYRNQGLNSLLRYYFFTLLPNSTIQSVIGYVDKGAPRMSLLKSLNYTFYDVTCHKFYHVHTKTRIYLAHLNKMKFNLALQFLKKHNQMIFHSYPWYGHKIQIDDKHLIISSYDEESTI